MGALDTVLIYCAPHLQGSPPQGCDLDRVLSGITDVTTSMTTLIKASSNQSQHTKVSSAIAALDRAVNTIKPCKAWFAAGGKGQDALTTLTCENAWESLDQSWSDLTNSLAAS